MSGHSKWSQIKRQKEVADIKRGQLFTKLANAITIAVRQGGGVTDPESNFRLRLAIEKAKAANMPKENIERAISRALGQVQGLEEVIYEGYGPSGVAVMVEVATDSKQRTTQEIKNILERAGGSLTGPGAVSFLFKSMGQITVSLQRQKAQEAILAVIDAGAEDVEEAGSQLLVYTKPEELNEIKERLLNLGFAVSAAELTMKPTTVTPVADPQTAQKILTLMEKLEALAETQKVYANFDIPDELLSGISSE